jgi:hypothetical protein
MDEYSTEALVARGHALLDEIDRQLDMAEFNLVAWQHLGKRHLRCTAQIREAVKDIVDRAYQRWRSRNKLQLHTTGRVVRRT